MFNNSIGRIDSAGHLLDQRTGDGVSMPDNITTGPDNDLWFTNAGNDSIGHTNGRRFEKITGDGISRPRAITTGPDGALWFTNALRDSIGRVTVDGKVSIYTSQGNIGDANDIVTGPNGALWFTNADYAQIGRITTKGVMTFFPTPSGSDRITVGPDGALWFTGNDSSIGRITVDGKVTTFRSPDLPRAGDIATGPDGTLWITNTDSAHPGVLRMTTDGTFTRYFDLNTMNSPYSIVAGHDKAMWFTNAATPVIGRISTSVSSAAPDVSADAGALPDLPTTGATDAPVTRGSAATRRPTPTPDPRCAVTVENRTGADRDVHLADATRGGGDRWDPQPQADAKIAAGAAESWASVDAAPGACHTEARLTLARDGRDDVTWKVSVTHGGAADDRATCTTSDDDFPCEVTLSPGAAAGAIDVLARLTHRT